MYSYIKGTVERISDSAVVIENNGIGFNISVSVSTASKLPKIGEQSKVFTFMHVKEDDISLFGFLSAEELSIFKMLLSVSGIGPKSAMSILSVLSPEQLMISIISDDITALSKAPGVGKRTAQRMVLELKDKIKKDSALEAASTQQQTIAFIGNEKQDSIDALVTLGYSRGEAMKAVMEVALENMTTAQIIKLALKRLASFRTH